MNKKFLTSFAAIVAAFSAEQALAIQSPLFQPESQSQSVIAPLQKDKVSVTNNGDLFTFVLKRNAETGLMMAEHESHSSHASHDSHSSHYSSRE